MAVKEESIIMHRTDENGNKVMQFPYTKAENIEGFSRMPNTTYSVGAVVACPYHVEFLLKCTQAGRTSDEVLVTTNITKGQVITDGSAKWEVIAKSITMVAISDNVITVTFIDGTQEELPANFVKTISGVKPDNSGNIDIVQLFPVWHLDCGNGGDGAFNPSSNVTISGTKNYTSFNIPSGVTVTIDKSAYIKCTGDVVINGTIKAVGAAGGSVSNDGESGYFAIGGAGGSANEYSPGKGGGALELKGGIAGVTAVMNYLHSENIIAANTIYSAGGGGGDWEQQHRGTPGVGGAGGGGVIIVCKNFTNNGAINANGENGGIGNSPYGAGGGGGGGGLVYIVCDKNNKTGTINVAGGSAGGQQSGYWGNGNGSAGSDGMTYIKERG